MVNLTTDFGFYDLNTNFALAGFDASATATSGTTPSSIYLYYPSQSIILSFRLVVQNSSTLRFYETSVSEVVGQREFSVDGLNVIVQRNNYSTDTVLEQLTSPAYWLTGDDTITLSNTSDIINARAGNDVIYDRGGDDLVYGGTGSDTFYSGQGSDVLDGGDGTDTVIYSGNGHNYNVISHEGHIDVYNGPDEVDILLDVEFIQFANVTVAVADIPSGGNADLLIPDSNTTAADVQTIARLYEAAFNRQPDLSGLNFWVDEWENGVDLHFIAQSFMTSTEFQNAYGDVNNMSNLDFLNQLYQNILDRDGDSGGLSFWSNELDNGVDRENVLISFSQSSENVAGTPYLNSMSESYNGYWTF